MARRKKQSNQYHLIVKVLQNGTTLSESHYPVLKNKGRLSLSNQGHGPLVLPHYPFPNNSIEFAEFDGKSIYLLVNYKWEGFTTAHGELININRRLKGVEEIKLSKGDYGSISYKDVRIMFKVEVFRPKKFERPVKRNQAYNMNPLDLALPHLEEKQNFAMAFAISLAFSVLLAGLLMSTRVKTPTTMAELPEEYVLPFIRNDYFSTAPEQLQNKLNRDQYIPSVISHYQSLTKLLYNWEGYRTEYLFPTTVALYEGMNRRKQDRINALMEEQQEIDAKVLATNSSALLLVPTVIGESINGKIQRGIDKMDLLHASLEELLQRRSETTEAWQQIQSHNFEEYRTIAKKRGLGKLSKIKPFERATDEEMMYREANELAQRADHYRYFIHMNIGDQDRLDPITDAPVAIPEGYRYGSALGGIDFLAADDKLYVIEASRYGERAGKKKVKEPLIGQLDEKLVTNYIRKHRYQLQQCYELALRRNDKAQGSMEWSWRVDSRGKISDVSLLQSSIPDKKMTRCIQKHISKWRFPRPRRGSVMVRYPFEFSPAKG